MNTPSSVPQSEHSPEEQALLEDWHQRIAKLEPEERELLFAIVLYPGSITFHDMCYAAYNPFQLDPPPEPEHLPALPQVRTYPWASSASSNQIDDPSPAERKRWRDELQQVRRERAAAFEQTSEPEHEAQDENVERTRRLSRAIFTLSDQGLIETSESRSIAPPRYNISVHPRIKNFVLNVARKYYEEKLAEVQQKLTKSRPRPRTSGEHATSLTELQPYIARMKILLNNEQYVNAVREYQNHLNHSLFKWGQWARMIELLEPILPHIDDKDFEPSQARIVLTELANAYSVRHNLQNALECYEQALNPYYHSTPSDSAWAVSNYGLCLLENGRLAQADCAFGLARDLGDDRDWPWVCLRQIGLAMQIGHREKAATYLQECRSFRPFSQRRPVWEARLALAEARVALLHDDPAAEQHLGQTIQRSKSKDAPGAMSEARAYTHRARLYLEQGRYEEAASDVQEASRIAERDGISQAMLIGMNARALHGQGLHKVARQKLDPVVRQELDPVVRHGFQGDVGERAQILADAAELYLEWGETDRASACVHSGLELAWPTGEPCSFAQPFRQLKPLIATLDINWQPAPVRESEPLPFEQEITTNVQQSRTLSKASPHKQDSCYIGAFEWVQIGTVACFGVDDEHLIRSVAGKLARLSWEPKNLTISHMGEEVPPPSNTPDEKRIIQVGERREFTELRFSHEEELAFDRLFVIIGIIGRNADDELAHAYINCRVDRLHTLLKRADNSTQSFNISEYATLIACGAGLPDSAIREKLQRDYLFGEHACNVRTFPPLSEVT